MSAFLAVVGWSLLAVFLLLLVLLLFPVSVPIELQQDQVVIQLKVLFLTFQLYPRREKQEAKTPEKESGQPAAESKQHTDEKEQAQAPSEKKKSRLDLSQLAQLVSTACWLMRIVFRLIQIRDIRIVYPVQGEDAAQTAIQYGRINAYLGSTLGVLQNFLNMHFKQVDILPDFNGNCKYQRYFYCKLQAIPLIMIVAALYALVRLKGEKVI